MFGSLYYLLSLDDNSKSRVVDTMILACMIIVFYYIAQTLRFGPSMYNCMSKDPAFRSCVQILRSDPAFRFEAIDCWHHEALRVVEVLN